MTLAMTRPYRHPKTGMYWVRKAVPETLRPIIGKRELKTSLQTKDPTEAKRRALSVIAEQGAIIAAARDAQRLGKQDLDAITGEYFERRRKEILETAQRGNWGRSQFDGEDVGHGLIPDQGRDEADAEARVHAWGSLRVAAELDRLGVMATPRFRERLALEFFKAEHRAIDAARAAYLMEDHPPASPSYPRFRPTAARSISKLFQEYAKSQELSPKTTDGWGKIIGHFERWLAGKPADQVTPEDVRRYAEEVKSGKGLSGRPLSAKTVNESYLASIKSTYGWAMQPGRALVTTNPAESVTVSTPRHETGPRVRAYSSDEVAFILRAAREQTTAYKRWVPWLLAFTGARVSEILNAKKADIGQAQGIPFIWIREQGEGESGERLKNTWSVRCVPLHSALLGEGFMAYVDSLADGDHLFPGKWADKHGDRTKTPANRLRDWLNTVRAPEPGVAPNHSFRHWLIKESKRAGIDDAFQRQLTGHSSKDAHGQYGPGDVPELKEALERIRSPL